MTLSGSETIVREMWAGRIPSTRTLLSSLEIRDTNSLTADDLYRGDQMHLGGVESTDRLIKLARVTDSMHVLDGGCGIGGTSRRIAMQRGARVDGVDLTPIAVQTANELNRLTGLDLLVNTTEASMTDLPFENGDFDVVILQHSAIQVEDKDGLFGECARVLKRGGAMIMHDWFTGPGGDIRYPVPWAEDESTSFVETFDVIEKRLKELRVDSSGFRDQSSDAVRWQKDSLKRLELKESAAQELSEAELRRRIMNESLLSNLTEKRLHVGFLKGRKH